MSESICHISQVMSGDSLNGVFVGCSIGSRQEISVIIQFNLIKLIQIDACDWNFCIVVMVTILPGVNFSNVGFNNSNKSISEVHRCELFIESSEK